MKRRHNSWILGAALLLTSMTAAWGQDASVRLPTLDVCAGGDIYVPVTVDPVDTLTSLDLTFSYDDTVLSALAVHQAPLLSTFAMTSDIATSGQVNILLTGTATAGTGTVAWVEFAVSGESGTGSALSWITSELNSGAVSSTQANGQVNVVSMPQSALSLPDDATGAPSSTVTVPVVATPASGSGLDIVVEFDESVLQFDAASTTPISSGHDLISNVTAPGRVLLALYGSSALTGTGAIVDLDFTVLESAAGFSPLILTKGLINEGEITSCVDHGTLRFCQPIAADDTTCDGVDDDCDGEFDEDYVVADCGTGECAASSTCAGGVETTCSVALATIDGQVCGDVSDTECTDPDSCLSGVCVPNDEASGTECGDPSDTQCTNPDTCDGAGACQDNHASPGAACGDQGLECQVNDSCDGSGGCTDNGNVSDGTACDDDLFCTTDSICFVGVCGGVVEGSLTPDSELTSVSLIGDTAGDCGTNDCVIDVDDDPDAPDGDWAVAASNNANTSMTLSFPAPEGSPTVGADLQEFRAQVRQFDTGQTGTPEARIELWENGLLLRAGVDEPVVGDGQILSFTWDAAELGTADGSLAEIRVVGTKAGGSSSVRNAVDIGAVEWNVVAMVGGGGPQTDCSSAGDACNVGVCNETTDSCEPQPANEDLACDDGLACNVGEMCQAGACAGGAPVDCSGAGGDCNTASCESAGAEGNCAVLTPLPEGTVCGDPSSGPCDNSDSCDSGGSCLPNHEPASTECRPDAGPCDIPEFCDGSGTCPGNVFEPEFTLCGDGSDTVCDNPDSCDASGGCDPRNEANGFTCDDGILCTADACSSGVCIATDNCAGDLVCESGTELCTTTVRLPDIDVCPGGDVYLPFQVDAVDGLTLLDLAFTYDPAVISPVELLQAPLLSDFTLIANGPPFTDEVDIALSGDPAATGGGTVVWVESVAVGPAGSSTSLNWIESDLDGGAIGSITSGGRVDVVAAQSALTFPDAAAGTPGGTLVVPIVATPANGLELDLVVEFDESVLQFVNATSTPITDTAGHLVNGSVTGPGQVAVSISGPTPLSGTGPIVDLEFSIVGQAGDSSPLVLTRGDIDEGSVTSCLDDGLLRVCDSVAQNDVTCDNVDDDCNGQIDDGFEEQLQTCDDLGPCDGNELLVQCIDGVATDPCVPQADDQCDDADNDCDGTPDDDYPTSGTSCGIGECAGNVGQLTCQAGGTEVDTCDPFLGATPDDNCDTLDNDCDGTADDDAPDTDSDTIGDCTDNCVDDPNTDQLDADGDLEGDVCDCAPQDPDNTPPAELGDTVFVGKSGTDALLSWVDEVDPGPFRVYRGYKHAAELFAYNHVCFDEPFEEPIAVDGDVPVPNRLFYYLVNREVCGRAGLGTDSSGVPRPNDDPCPSSNTDTDGDAVDDALDNCPFTFNAGQEDQDGDGMGDACDLDGG